MRKLIFAAALAFSAPAAAQEFVITGVDTTPEGVAKSAEAICLRGDTQCREKYTQALVQMRSAWRSGSPAQRLNIERQLANMTDENGHTNWWSVSNGWTTKQDVSGSGGSGRSRVSCTTVSGRGWARTSCY